MGVTTTAAKAAPTAAVATARSFFAPTAVATATTAVATATTTAATVHEKQKLAEKRIGAAQTTVRKKAILKAVKDNQKAALTDATAAAIDAIKDKAEAAKAKVDAEAAAAKAKIDAEEDAAIAAAEMEYKIKNDEARATYITNRQAIIAEAADIIRDFALNDNEERLNRYVAEGYLANVEDSSVAQY